MSTKLEQINTSISNTNTNLNSHISNTTPHIQPGERDKWNNKLDESQVSQMITAVIDSAPETLNTLNELAAALGDDPNFATTVTTEIGKKVDKNDFSTHTNDMDLHVASGEKEYWNDKRYSSLTEAPHILEDESDRVVFADENNNIIARIDKDGIATTVVTANKVLVDGVDATTKFNELNTHTTDTVRHVTQEDKNAWNAKTTATQAGEIAVEAATKVKNELLDGVATDANTLNKLNTKISNVNTSLTTHTGQTDIHVSKSAIEGYATNATNAAVAIVCGNISEDLNTLEKINTKIDNTTSTLNTAINNKANTTDLTEHTSKTDIHVSTTEKEAWNSKPTQEEASTIATNVTTTAINNLINNAPSGSQTLKGLDDKINSTKNELSQNLSNHINDTVKHVTQAEKDSWNSKSTFSGDYDDLLNAPTIKDNEDGKVNFVDSNNYVIARIDKDGFQTTKVVAESITLKDSDLKTTLDTLDTKMSNHIDDKDIHVKPGERESWNSRTTVSQVSQMLAELVDSAPAELNTLNELAKALGDDPNFATTILGEVGKVNEALDTHKETENIHITRTEIEGIASSATNTAISTVVGTAPTDYNTLGKLNSKVDSLATEVDKKAAASSLTTHTNNTSIHNSKTDIEGWIATAKNEAVNNAVSQVLGDIPSTLNTLGKLNTDLLGKISDASDNAAEDLQEHIDNTVMHVTQTDKNNWNSKSTFSGNYDDLTNAPIDQETSTGELNIVDNQNYILAKFNKDGLRIENISADEVNVNGISATTKFNELNSHIEASDIHVSKIKIEEYATNATNNAVRIVVGNIDENLNTLEKLNTDVTNRINEKLDSNLGAELEGKVLVVNEQGDIETSDRLGGLESKHETLKTDVLALISEVSTNKKNIEANKTSIGENATNIATNQQSIAKLNSDVEDLNNNKVNKEDLDR